MFVLCFFWSVYVWVLFLSACDLIAVFSMASGSSGTGSSSARISAVLRGSIRIPLWSVMPVQALTAVQSAFWDCEPGQFSYKHSLHIFTCIIKHSISTSMTQLMAITSEFPELNLVKIVTFGELTCKAGLWMVVAFPRLIGNCKKN